MVQHVFLSYASADRANALHLADLLETRGVATWIDRKSIEGGTSWTDEIVEGIKGCAALIVLVSPASMASRNVNQELQLAWEHERKIVPLILEMTPYPNRVAYILAGWQWVEVLNQPEAVWLPRVLSALHGLGIDAGTGADPSTPTPAEGVPAPTATPSRAASHQLPTPRTSFIGREREVTAVVQLLAEPGAQLVTVAGPGGIGKTRLAIAVAEACRGAFADGVYFVGLAGITDPSQVLPAIAQALQVQTAVGLPLGQVLANVLRDRQALLVLDNFEQVVDAAPDVANLVTACPQLKVLVTSRELLRVSEEAEYAVPTLSLPEESERGSLTRIGETEAIRLFVERANAARPGFRLTSQNALAVVGICQRLDGLPLAIELAAARLRLLSPEALLGRLEQRLPLLTGGPRDAPARQQTLRSTIAWSYDLLTPSEQRLFRRLGVFVGGWTVEAQEAVCGLDSLAASPRPPSSDTDTLVDLDSLLTKSLVRRSESASGEPRFHMLETIREFARDQLGEAGELDELQRRHAAYLADLAEHAHEAFSGPEDLAWFQRFGDEQRNVDAAVAWCLQLGPNDPRGVEIGCRLVASLAMYLLTKGRFREGRRWLDAMLERADKPEAPVSVSTRVTLYSWAAMAAWEQGEVDLGGARWDRARAVAGDTHPSRDLVFSVAMRQYDHALRGQLAEAAEVGEKAMALAQQMNDPWALGYVWGTIGDVARVRGDDDQALAAYREFVRWNQIAGTRMWQGISNYYLSTVQLRLGALDDAELSLRAALATFRQFGTLYLYGLALTGLAESAAQRGQAARAVRLFARLDRLYRDLGILRQPIERAESERDFAVARSQLDPAAFASAWAEGETMSIENAIDYALGTG